MQTKFPTMFSNDNFHTGLDYSRNTEDLFEEIPPFTKGSDGKWLNDTAVPVIKKTGVVNIQEKIDSFKDEVDIYKILAKVAASGDDSFLNVVNGVYGDFSKIPDNRNDFNDLVSDNLDAMQKLPKNISAMLLQDDFDETEFYKAVNEYNEKINKKEEIKKDE